MSERRLVVNADDFGFAHDVNRGIIEAHTSGILTATTLMANGNAFADAVRLARDHPSLDVGCHLVLVQGPSVARAGVELPQSIPELLAALTTRRFLPYEELKPQVDKILQAGIRPLHLDTHKHTHLWPPVLEAVARLSADYKIPWVRRPFDFPLEAAGIPWPKIAFSNALGAIRSRFHSTLNAYGCRTTDHFAGFRITGSYRAAELASLIGNLPEGSTEFMCHPGHCSEELRESATRLKESREVELEALVSPEVRRALGSSRVKLVRFSEL
ncbi:MAG: ChbG/HpnK family deacetylase [Bryobacteraceae bacterium]|nr:ChbG/HpnK family deacetylase [Bryobacteraceae bacterium]